jgi:integrase/recombinase XerD
MAQAGVPMNQSSDQLVELFAPCIGAYSERTIKGYSADLSVFIDWCSGHLCNWLPASPQSVAGFVAAQVKEYCISTIKRRLCAITFAHRLSELPEPTNHPVVKLAVRRAVRIRAQRPKQVRGLTKDILRRIVAACPATLAGSRDAALISAGYDTLCRSSELAVMAVEHVSFEVGGAATILIPRSKSDAAGDGRLAYLSPETAALLSGWLEAAQLQTGPLFRALHLNRPYEGPLATSSIRRIIKRATRRAGFDAAIFSALSGHSMRIGAAQDMMVAGFDALDIMQAGGWKSANVVLRYVEHAATRELHERRWRSCPVVRGC